MKWTTAGCYLYEHAYVNAFDLSILLENEINVNLLLFPRYYTLHTLMKIEDHLCLNWLYLAFELPTTQKYFKLFNLCDYFSRVFCLPAETFYVSHSLQMNLVFCQMLHWKRLTVMGEMMWWIFCFCLLT